MPCHCSGPYQVATARGLLPDDHLKAMSSVEALLARGYRVQSPRSRWRGGRQDRRFAGFDRSRDEKIRNHHGTPSTPSHWNKGTCLRGTPRATVCTRKVAPPSRPAAAQRAPCANNGRFQARDCQDRRSVAEGGRGAPAAHQLKPSGGPGDDRVSERDKRCCAAPLSERQSAAHHPASFHR